MNEQDMQKTATFAMIRASNFTIEQLMAIRMICVNPQLVEEYILSLGEEFAKANEEPPQVDPATE